mmetsp:Transcript_20447/g.30256  ORF Transcript_20447/g.30256 Transcript_20447/m.30256 type:complete len:623 (-) Transcript_20447:215-2083(-)
MPLPEEPSLFAFNRINIDQSEQQKTQTKDQFTKHKFGLKFPFSHHQSSPLVNRESRSNSSYESTCESGRTTVPTMSRSSSINDINESPIIEDIFGKMSIKCAQNNDAFYNSDESNSSPNFYPNNNNDNGMLPPSKSSPWNNHNPFSTFGFNLPNSRKLVLDESLNNISNGPVLSTHEKIDGFEKKHCSLASPNKELLTNSSPLIEILSVLNSIESVLRLSERGMCTIPVLEECLRLQYPQDLDALNALGGLEQLATLAPHRISIAPSPSRGTSVVFMPIKPHIRPSNANQSKYENYCVSQPARTNPKYMSSSSGQKPLFVPLSASSTNALENLVMKESTDILSNTAVGSLKAVELANTLRARLGAESLAHVRELRGGLLTLLERYPYVFNVERIPKSDRVTLIQRESSPPKFQESFHPFCIHIGGIPSYMTDDDILFCVKSCSRAKPKITVHRSNRRERVISVSYTNSKDAEYARKNLFNHPAWNLTASHVACDGNCEERKKRNMEQSSWKSTSSVSNYPNRILEQNKFGSSDAFLVISTLTSDKFVPTQAWPISLTKDWPIVEAIKEILRSLGGFSTISKLRGLLRSRLDSSLTIKSVPLKALIVAYSDSFVLVGNRVSLS